MRQRPLPDMAIRDLAVKSDHARGQKSNYNTCIGYPPISITKNWDDEVCRLMQQSGLVLCLGGFLFLPLTLKTLVFDSVHDILNIRPIHLTTPKVSTRHLQATRTTLH